MANAEHVTGPADGFLWHPAYTGKSAASVRATIASELASDQRAHALTLEGAEEHEGDSLASIIALDRKWGPYDLNWAESSPEELADRIVAFELARERRQELISYAAYRDAAIADETSSETDAAGGQRLESPMARGIVVLVVALILVALWYFLFR